MKKYGSLILVIVLIVTAFVTKLSAQETKSTENRLTFDVQMTSVTNGTDTVFEVKIDKERALNIVDKSVEYGTKTTYVMFKLPDMNDVKEGLGVAKAYTDTAVSVIINNETVESYLDRVKSLVEADTVPIVE